MGKRFGARRVERGRREDVQGAVVRQLSSGYWGPRGDNVCTQEDTEYQMGSCKVKQSVK
jgi:hypothetical protein